MKFLFVFFLCLLACEPNPDAQVLNQDSQNETEASLKIDISTEKTIHMIVALCDNKYQGIVPVPSKIGNGQDPDNNLYWGAMFGIKTYFKNSSKWKFLHQEKRPGEILERLIFKHKETGVYLVAEAYDGKFIELATIDYIKALNGDKGQVVPFGDTHLGLLGKSELMVYIGHNGLMDFDMHEETLKNGNPKQKDAMILACASKPYFEPYFKQANANPLLWTTNLMAPEAYTIHDAIEAYLQGQSPKDIQFAAAKAYNKYQKCGENAAKKLLVTGYN